MHETVNLASIGLRGFESLPAHRRMLLNKEKLNKMYKQGMSMMEISKELNCSCTKIVYWMNKYNIVRRSRSEAIYLKKNPKGDPFTIKRKLTPSERELLGFGLGLYWGEGNKRNKHSIRLGNTDPELIKKFIKFLTNIYNIDKNKLIYGLQIFSDIDKEKAKSYWMKKLNATPDQFQKIIVTPSRGCGTYQRKMKYGVLTLYYHNIKLRNILNNKLR